MLQEGEWMLKKIAFPTPSSHRGEVGNPGDPVQDLKDNVELLEEGMSWIGTFLRMPFRFMQSIWSPSEQTLMPGCQQYHPVLEDWVHYFIHIRVTLGKGGGNQPPPIHAWSGSLVVGMLQEGLEEQITEAVVPALREAILFFGWQSHKEGLPLEGTRDIGFCLMDLTSWSSMAAQVEVTVSTVQEGCHAFAEAVIEKRTKARSPRHTHRRTKAMKTPAAAYNVEEWIGGMEEVAPE